MKKEKTRFNVEEHTTLDNKIIDVFSISHRYIHELETKLKKQAVIIDKVSDCLKCRNIENLKYYDEPSETSSYEIITVDVLKILENREV